MASLRTCVALITPFWRSPARAEDLKELLSETVGLPARGQRLVLGGVGLGLGRVVALHSC